MGLSLCFFLRDVWSYVSTCGSFFPTAIILHSSLFILHSSFKISDSVADRLFLCCLFDAVDGGLCLLELVVVDVVLPRPAYPVPEGIASVVAGEGDEGYAVNAHDLQLVHAEAYHPGADTPAAVFPGYADMIQGSLPPVGAAEDRAHDLPVKSRPDRRRRVPADEALHILAGIVQRADAETADGHPQRPHIVIIICCHR